METIFHDPKLPNRKRQLRRGTLALLDGLDVVREKPLHYALLTRRQRIASQIRKETRALFDTRTARAMAR